jgi:hypothetical protein
MVSFKLSPVQVVTGTHVVVVLRGATHLRIRGTDKKREEQSGGADGDRLSLRMLLLVFASGEAVRIKTLGDARPWKAQVSRGGSDEIPMIF